MKLKSTILKIGFKLTIFTFAIIHNINININKAYSSSRIENFTDFTVYTLEQPYFWVLLGISAIYYATYFKFKNLTFDIPNTFAETAFEYLQKGDIDRALQNNSLIDKGFIDIINEYSPKES